MGSVDPAELTAEELFTLFTARAAVGQFNESVADLELSYARYVDDGDNAGAAWTSLFLAFSAAARGDLALSGGWGATAGRHFEGLAECKAHVLAGVLLSYEGMTAGDYDGVVDSMIAARELPVDSVSLISRCGHSNARARLEKSEERSRPVWP